MHAIGACRKLDVWSRRALLLTAGQRLSTGKKRSDLLLTIQSIQSKFVAKRAAKQAPHAAARSANKEKVPATSAFADRARQVGCHLGGRPGRTRRSIDRPQAQGRYLCRPNQDAPVPYEHGSKMNGCNPMAAACSKRQEHRQQAAAAIFRTPNRTS